MPRNMNRFLPVLDIIIHEFLVLPQALEMSNLKAKANEGGSQQENGKPVSTGKTSSSAAVEDDSLDESQMRLTGTGIGDDSHDKDEEGAGVVVGIEDIVGKGGGSSSDGGNLVSNTGVMHFGLAGSDNEAAPGEVTPSAEVWFEFH